MAVLSQMVVGATKPPIVAIWEDANGNRINLTGGNARIQGVCDSMPGVVIDSLGALTDPVQGEATFASAGTLIRLSDMVGVNLTEATFAMRVKFTDAAGKFDWSELFHVQFLTPPIPQALVLYNLARKKILDGTLSLSADTLKFMLVKTTYQADKDHTAVSSVSAHEFATGASYAGGFAGSGRKTMANKTFGANNDTDRGFMDCDDPSWTSLSGDTIGYIVVIKEITSDALSLPVGYVDIGSFLTTGATFTHVVPTEGITTY